MASRRDFGLEEILDFFPFAPVAQFAQGLAFDLADTFTGDVEVLAYFFQCARTAIFEAEAQVEDLRSRSVRQEKTSSICSFSKMKEAASSGATASESSMKSPR